ncbi:protein SOB FIVE-LIKE 4-like [Gastrolobium bilobum]|uniref:protein SOB FIVE-LIKE 4-like n=1 Tax=Gastrolobium bilobum TaxID=150636 RepID=UPI002AB2F6C4|nr:protein SOB FIVE-LIKE 4-like [Gastrolobium bilobum]XP_061353420.1 protein SOB FIVE-LIKE 4-like [Gastrolobium bilobum]
MEPPPIILEDPEECHSSESGWTMYIGSPIDEDMGHCDNDDDDEVNDDNMDFEGTQADPKVESDDSMASDASSGPSHYGINPLENSEGGYNGFTHFQQKEEEEYDKDKCCLDHKNASKTKENQIAEKSVEKKEMVFINSKGKGPVQGGRKVKVRKNH